MILKYVDFNTTLYSLFIRKQILLSTIVKSCSYVAKEVVIPVVSLHLFPLVCIFANMNYFEINRRTKLIVTHKQTERITSYITKNKTAFFSTHRICKYVVTTHIRSALYYKRYVCVMSYYC